MACTPRSSAPPNPANAAVTGRVRTPLVPALVVNATLVGATWDQTIKQLPTRQVIGAEAFSAYS